MLLLGMGRVVNAMDGSLGQIKKDNPVPQGNYNCCPGGSAVPPCPGCVKDYIKALELKRRSQDRTSGRDASHERLLP